MKGRTKNNLTRQSILRALRGNADLLQKHAVRRIALFGSYATGKQSGKSDLDFLVEFERPTYDNLLDLSKDLERLFGRKVDILTPQGLESIRVKSIAESIRKWWSDSMKPVTVTHTTDLILRRPRAACCAWPSRRMAAQTLLVAVLRDGVR